jgi:hypothetical protein
MYVLISIIALLSCSSFKREYRLILFDFICLLPSPILEGSFLFLFSVSLLFGNLRTPHGGVRRHGRAESLFPYMWLTNATPVLATTSPTGPPYCSLLLPIAPHCSPLLPIAPYCSLLLPIAPYCSLLLPMAPYFSLLLSISYCSLFPIAPYCYLLLPIATYC